MGKKSKSEKSNDVKIVASNRKARHNYHIVDSVEAGLVLTGSEVKSLRQGRASLGESFATIRDGEVFLYQMHIPVYSHAGYAQHDPTRPRKLLLHKAEIDRLIGKTKERGLTLVPLSCYFRSGFAKVELALARGKKMYDKRAAEKEREAQLEVDRAIRRRR